jgi:anhydro-N-acetylmuramic acid kinase
VDRLHQISKKSRRNVIGLMSGTSADGIDAALVVIEGVGPHPKLEVKSWAMFPHDPEVREEVLAVASGEACDAGRIAALNFLLGHAFADAAIELCRKADVPLGGIDLIGSHGQTVFHRGPGEPEGSLPCTLQIGEPSVIAERTGVTTVADFRPRDMAAGGQGAPLVPVADYVLFSVPDKSRCTLNLGGIANVTFLPMDCSLDGVTAFDTGPGNMVLDAIATIYSGGEKSFDHAGQIAKKGRTKKALLEKLLAHPYFRMTPPKSTGREMFGYAYARQVLEQGALFGIKEQDIMRTAVTLTARTVGEACREHFPKGLRIDEVFVSGGGVHNETLMKEVRKELKPAIVKTSADAGVPPDAKEAVAFAVLANETIAGRAGNVPSVTGASRPVVLGKIVPGS